MKIQDIYIKNFRGIDDLHITNFDSRMNIIVGVNGAGKTSILDAMSMLLSWLIARMKSTSAKGINPSDADVKLGAKNPCAIEMALDNDVFWSICKSKSFSSRKKQVSCKTNLAKLNLLAESIVENAENGGNVPIIMYYPVERAIASAPVNLHKAEPVIWDAYSNALTGNANFRSLFEWYRRQEDIENEMIRDNADYRDKSLNAVRTAISAFFPDFSELRVRRRPNQAMVVKKEDEVIEFTQLSQGEKCYLSLVCDIARRLSIGNPALENPLDGEGVILIDEADLHLHPKWQAEIASKLMVVFPNCQFFLSTHSAQVLSDIKRSQIILINGGKRVDIAYEPYGKLTSQIMSNYFDMPYQRNLSIAKDIENAFTALRHGNKNEFNALFDKLLPILGATDRDMTNLIIEAKRKGVR